MATWRARVNKGESASDKFVAALGISMQRSFCQSGSPANPRLASITALFATVPRRRHSSPGYLSPIAFERQYAATALEPGAHEHAVVLAPVKERPGNVAASCTASVPAVRDSHSPRRRWQHAGRDEKMLSAEPKDHSKEEDRMLSNQIP